MAECRYACPGVERGWPTFPIWNCETGDAFTPRMPMRPVQYAPNQRARLVFPLVQVDENDHQEFDLEHVNRNDDQYQPARPVVPLEQLPEDEDFLLYDYYDDDSDIEDSGIEDSDMENSDGEHSDIFQDEVCDEENTLHERSRKRAREEDEEEDERTTRRFRHDPECFLDNPQNQPAVSAEIEEHNDVFQYEDEQTGNEKVCSEVKRNAGVQDEREEEPLPGTSKKRAREEDEEEQERSDKHFRHDPECFMCSTQNQPAVGVQLVDDCDQDEDQKVGNEDKVLKYTLRSRKVWLFKNNENWGGRRRGGRYKHQTFKT